MKIVESKTVNYRGSAKDVIELMRKNKIDGILNMPEDLAEVVLRKLAVFTPLEKTRFFRAIGLEFCFRCYEKFYDCNCDPSRQKIFGDSKVENNE